MNKLLAASLVGLVLAGCGTAPQLAAPTQPTRLAAAGKTSPKLLNQNVLEDMVKAHLLAEGNLVERKVLKVKINMQVGSVIVGRPGTYRTFEAVVQDTGEAGPYTYNLFGTVNGTTREVTIKRS